VSSDLPESCSKTTTYRSLFVIVAGDCGSAQNIQLAYPDSNVASYAILEFRGRKFDFNGGGVSPGHVYVILGRVTNNGTYWYGLAGFYPDQGKNKIIRNVLSRGLVTRTLEDAHSDVSFRVRITDEQEASVNRLITTWNYKVYSLPLQNCVTLARDVARTLGLNVPTFNPMDIDQEFPARFVQILKGINVEDRPLQFANNQDKPSPLPQQEGGAASHAPNVSLDAAIERSSNNDPTLRELQTVASNQDFRHDLEQHLNMSSGHAPKVNQSSVELYRVVVSLDRDGSYKGVSQGPCLLGGDVTITAALAKYSVGECRPGGPGTLDIYLRPVASGDGKYTWRLVSFSHAELQKAIDSYYAAHPSRPINLPPFTGGRSTGPARPYPSTPPSSPGMAPNRPEGPILRMSPSPKP
jgi:hypothetical protein